MNSLSGVDIYQEAYIVPYCFYHFSMPGYVDCTECLCLRSTSIGLHTCLGHPLLHMVCTGLYCSCLDRDPDGVQQWYYPVRVCVLVLSVVLSLLLSLNFVISPEDRPHLLKTEGYIMATLLKVS